jgi:hypothetical protein
MNHERWSLACVLHGWRVVAAIAGSLGLCVGGTLRAALDPATLIAVDVGGPSVSGSSTDRAGVVEVLAGGTGIGLSSDQFHFASAPEPGDFDVQARVPALKPTDLWAKAGLMLRDGLGPNTRFTAVFTTPSGAGCLFQSRDTVGGVASNQGTLPANQPFTWLRLRREGDLITGYAGYDGWRWTVLGTRTLALGTNALLGLAVTSHSPNATLAEFRDLGNTVSTLTQQVPVDLEPPGPCSRRTALVISEIMYNPAPRVDGKNLEFVELYNSQPYFEEIGSWRLTGEIEFTFPPGTVIPGGGYLVVAAVPADVATAYGVDGVLGPFTGRLDNGGGALRLLGDRGAVLLELEYNDRAPWPELADGAGHSLVLARPSYGEGDPRAWGASRVKGGSPGMPEAVGINSLIGLRINEWLMPDDPGDGFVELFNAGSEEADLGGVRLGRAPASMTFAVPTGTRLAPGGFVQFSWAQLGFRPDATGDTLLLESADGSRFLDSARCRPQLPGTSAGLWPNGGAQTRVLPQPTPGAANARPGSEIVINEVHHSPLSGDTAEEFVELYNAGSTDLDLSSWQFDSGITFVFPAGAGIPAGGYLVVARNAARLRELHPELGASQVVGDFLGSLSGRGESLALCRPITIRNSSGQNEEVLAVVSEAAYAGSDRWNRWSDEGGSSLELIDARGDAMLSANWADSDESSRAEWTTVEFTGVLDNGPSGGGPPGPGGGGVSPDSLHLTLLGEGECLVDNVEVIAPGGANRLANGTFEAGTAGWTFSGNHIRSSLETTQGDQSSQSLHLRASNNGDTGANKIYVKLTQALTTNTTVTLRARVKWLRGWPEILLRLHGNYLEAYGRLATPTASGTPGARNSCAQDNAGPAFDAVSHFPVVPGTNEPVVVTARVDDPDGLASVTLRYRLDPGTALTDVPMQDDGTGGDPLAGDGLYSATLPAPGQARLVAFTVEARDAATSPSVSVFPPGGSNRECLVRFGEGSQSGAFGTYRLWVTQANSDSWRNRPVLSNEPIECTFVYGNSRVIYNSGGRFAGSPYHQQFTAGPASDAHFVIEFPKDDRVLGAAALNKLHAPGNGAFDDTLLQREQAVYWMARKSGLPWLHRRFFHFYVNGAKKRTLMEDTQVGSDDVVEEFWPDDSAGNLYKMQPWFEFPDATSQNLQMSSSMFVLLNRYTTTGGALKLARYRWNWLVRGAEGTANDYTNVLELLNVATDYANASYGANVENLVDVDGWFRYFAINHAVGNWDSVGYQNQQNTYSYKPRNGRWELILWDANIVLGNSRSDGPSNLPLFFTRDPTLSRWFAAGSPFRRRYLVALHELVNGPMQVQALAPMLDAKYAAFQDHGVSAGSPSAIKTWITSARSDILSQINREAAAFSVTSVSGVDSLTVQGKGPLDMAWLEVNGAIVPLTWDTTSAWRATVTLTQPLDRLVVIALNALGEPLSGAQQEIALGVERRLTLNPEGSSLVFQYPVLRSGRYQLQWTPTLLAPNWQMVTNPSATLGTLNLRVPAPSAPAFYRVLEP